MDLIALISTALFIFILRDLQKVLLGIFKGYSLVLPCVTQLFSEFLAIMALDYRYICTFICLSYDLPLLSRNNWKLAMIYFMYFLCKAYC